MAKDFWEPWEWRLWLGDPDLGMCHPATRGLWMDALCAMMERKTHSLTGTPDQLARVCRCSAADLFAAAADLELQGAAKVVRQSDSITLTCRKRHRELELSGLRSKAGKAGADSKWQRDSKADSKADSKTDGNPLIVLPTGCHAPGTGILMFDGTIKNIEDILVGDFVMGPDVVKCPHCGG